MSATQTENALEQNFLTKLNAQPDGKYHWTKKQLDKLKEFEEFDPFTHQIDSWGYRRLGKAKETDRSELLESLKKESIKNQKQLPKPENPNKSYKDDDLRKTMCDYSLQNIAEGTINLAEWKNLFAQYFKQHKSSNTSWGDFPQLFYNFEQAMREDNSVQMIEILQLYFLAFQARRVSSEYHASGETREAYLFLQRNKYDKKKLLQQVYKVLESDNHNDDLKKFFTCLFPQDFKFTVDLFDENYADACMYDDEMLIFFDNFDVFAHLYKSVFYKGVFEPLLLMTIKKYNQKVVNIFEQVFYSAYRSCFSVLIAKKNYGKVRKQLKLIDALHHQDVLDYLVNYSYEIEISKFIRNWLERFPIFTLKFLLAKLNTSLKYAENYRYTKAQMVSYLDANPAVLKVLQPQITDEQELALLTELTKNISQEEIDTAYQQAISEPKTQSTATKSNNKSDKQTIKKVSKIRFPTLAMERFAIKTSVDKDSLLKQELYTESEIIIDYIGNNDNLAFLVSLYDEIGEVVERDILTANYANFSLEQKCLAYLAVKPSWIVSPAYQATTEDIYYFSEDDFVPLNLPYTINKKNLHASYPTIARMCFNNLSENIHHGLLQGDIPLESYGFTKYDFCVNDLGKVVNDYLIRFSDTVIDFILDRYYPMFYQYNVWIFTMSISVDSYRVVPYYINAFNSKTKSHNMTEYFAKYPKTVINEVVYLLFTKQTDKLLKKAKTNAKVFWDWLIENEKQQLLAVLAEYDKQLKKPQLVEFLAKYEDNQQALAQHAQATTAETQSITADDSGIPIALQNDDWQKATRKRNIAIPDHINKSNFPAPTITKTGEQLPKDAFERLLKMLFVNTFDKPVNELLPSLAYLTKDSQTALADAMWSHYEDLLLSTKDKWLMMASGVLYHAQLDDKVWQFIKRWESNPHKRSSIKLSFAVLAQQAISRHTSNQGNTASSDEDALASDRALRMLIKISQKSRATLRPVAESELIRYSQAVGLTKEELSDKLIPTLGLNAQGKRQFDFGTRQFTMGLDADLKPTFTDNNGKRFKNLPKAGQKDDEEKAKQAHDELKEIKKQLKAFKQDDMPRFEQMLITQRRITKANFIEFYVNNPLMLRVTHTLVWGTFAKDNPEQLIQPFRVVETGEILDINDDDLLLTDDVLIGMVHPLQLTEEQKNQLGQSLQEDEIVQPFLQVARPTYRLTADEAKTNTITRFNDEKFATGSLIGLQNKGWVSYYDTGGICNSYEKKIGQHNFGFCFKKGFYLDEGVPKDDEGQTLEPIKLYYDEDDYVNEKASDIEISEFIYVIDSMARV